MPVTVKRKADRTRRPSATAGWESTPIVISLMNRNTTVLGGQEVRWGRIVQGLTAVDTSKLTILCTSSLVEAWESSEIGPINAQLSIFTERRSKLGTWIAAQIFALRRIPRGAIVHLTGPGMLILPAAVIARTLKRCKVVTSLTTSRVLPFRKERFPRKGYWLFWAALKISHLVDALNPQIDIRGMIDPDKLSIAPCSFSDMERFRSANRKANHVVFAGHLNWQKGSDLLVGIVRQWPRNTDCKLVICGSGPYESQIRSAAGNRQDIEIRRTQKLEDVFADAKVFLSVQQWDNYPSQALLEAMLCECSVVATDVGDTGLLVQPPWGRRLPLDSPPGDYIEAAMQFLQLDDRIQRAGGSAAREFVTKHHSRERYLEYLRSVWAAAGTSGRVPAPHTDPFERRAL